MWVRPATVPGMQILIQGEVSLYSYGQIAVQSGDSDYPMVWESMGGQQNGICGAATAGSLVLMTGRYRDKIPFTVELHDAEPEVAAEWEEIVEVSFRPVGDLRITSFDELEVWNLHLPDSDYRVRYSACGVDWDYKNGYDPTDRVRAARLLLQFWPSAPAPDRIIRQTTRSAAHMHELAREAPLPPTPEEKAEAARQAEVAKYEAARQFALKQETESWGGRLPNDRIRALGSIALSVAAYDRGLPEALSDATDEDQAHVARWIARRTLTEAGMTALPWIVQALTEVEAGRGLLPVFQDDHAPWLLLRTDPDLPQTVVTTLDGRHPNSSQQYAALPALLALKHDDTLKSALLAFNAAAATFGPGHTTELIAEIREAFPEIFARYASEPLAPQVPPDDAGAATRRAIVIINVVS